MSGTPRVKPPRNNAEWARNTEKRQSAVEHPTSQRVGRWVLSEHPDTGALIASHVDGGSTVLAMPPAPSDDAGVDAVVRDEAVLSLTKTALQTIGGATTVTWDGVLTDVGGWTSGVVTGGVTDVAVPISGDYFLTCTLGFPATNGNGVIVGIRVNGTTVLQGIYTDAGGIGMTVHVMGLMPLLAGDILSVAAASQPAANAGGMPVTGSTVPSMLTATLVSTGQG